MIPPGMLMGEYLPLITPVQQPAPGHSGGQATPQKVIIKTYWGCGDTVRSGQPKRRHGCPRGRGRAPGEATPGVVKGILRGIF